MVAETKKYEIAYVLTPSLSDEEALAVSEKLSTLVEESRGAIRHRENPKKHRLSYPIKKQGYGYFGWITFDATADAPAVVEKKVKSIEGILRHLIVVGEEVPPQPLRIFTPRSEPSRISTRPTPESAPASEKKLDLEELDKKLEEILGK